MIFGRLHIAACAIVATAMIPAVSAGQGGGTMPELTVTEGKVTEARARGLQNAMGLRGNPRTRDGAVRYLNPEKFHKLPFQADKTEGQNEHGNPVRVQGLDVAALRSKRAFGASQAQSRALGQMKQAGLSVEGARQVVRNSTLELVEANGQVALNVPIDTTVTFEFQSGSTKIVGPGAKAKVVYDDEGEVAQVVYANRATRQGRQLRVLNRSQGDEKVRRMLGMNAAGLSAEVVYYAPDIDKDVKRIVPHFLYSGRVNMGGQSIEVRPFFIPAIEDAPEVTIAISQTGAAINAAASVTGGTGPYTYSWTSSSTDITGNGGTASYTPRPRQGSPKETLTVTVEDSDGLMAHATVEVNVTWALVRLFRPLHPELMAPTAPAASPPGTIDAGAQFVGTSYASAPLSLTPDNARGFRDRFVSEGISFPYFFGESSAWETDWKCPTLGGSDNSYMDNVDIAFFTGHANGNGFVLSSNRSDTFVHYNDARWGDRDLEWVIIAACGPVQTGAQTRWRNSFRGLHQILGYSTNSRDTRDEGRRFADYILRTPFLWFNQPLTIREAWIQTATDIQGSDVQWGILMPVRTDGANNYNDHFHGKGPVGPKIQQSEISYIMVIRGWC
jgi:hypothetical protein